MKVKANFDNFETTKGKIYDVIESKVVDKKHDGSDILTVKVIDNAGNTYWASIGNEFDIVNDNDSDSLIPDNVNMSNVKQSIEIDELTLYAINTSKLYINLFKPIQINLYKKYVKGIYNPELAQKAILNTLSTIQKAYIKEFCSKDFAFRFNADERKALANNILEHYVIDFPLYPDGNFLN